VVLESNTRDLFVNVESTSQLLSHHPACEHYDNHVLTIFNRRVCLGCTATIIGILISLLIDLLIVQSYFGIINTIRFVLIPILFIPAIVQLRVQLKPRWIKFMFRFLLGVGIYLGIQQMYLLENLVSRLLGIILMISFFFGYTLVRGSESCDKCII
jgi:hypothetical protein